LDKEKRRKEEIWQPLLIATDLVPKSMGFKKEMFLPI